MTTIDSKGNIHKGTGAPGAGRFDGKAFSAPSGALVADVHDGLDDQVIGGDSLEKISAAQARRDLSVGQRVQVVYLGRTRAGDDGAPILRTVTKQTDHQMITTADGAEQGAYLDWAGVGAQRDENGAVVIAGADGLPFVAFVPLDDDTDAIQHPQTKVHVQTVKDHVRAQTSDRPAVLDELAGSQVPAIRNAVAKNPHAPTDALTHIAQTATDEYTLEAVARHANADATTMEHLAGSAHRSVRYHAASSEMTGPHTLITLSRDAEIGVRAGAARNANTPTEVLDHLATDRASEVRQSVASNPRTSPDVLDRLSRSDGFSMAQVGKNTSASPETLRRLADDTSTGNQTRAMVASNPAAPRDVIARSVTDQDVWVRQHAASNQNLTAVERSTLASDPSDKVRRAVAGTPGAASITAFVDDPDGFVRTSYAKNAALSPDVLTRLASDEFPAVRATVAQHPNTPTEVLRMLMAQPGAIGASAERALAGRV